MYRIAINRPILTLMFVLATVIFGWYAFKTMPVALFPKVDFPIVTVRTPMPGADPQTVESRVTDKIEEAVSGIEGLDVISSQSAEGMSVVVLQFLLDKNINEAANDVRDKVSGVILPPEAEKPVVSKLDIGAAGVISVFVASDKAKPTEMMELIDKKIKPKLQRIPGVGGVNVIGYREREIKIYPDPFALAKYGLSTADLRNKIATSNIKRPGGRTVGSTTEIVVKTEADSKSLDELRNLMIKDGVRLRDIARIEDSLEDARSFASYNGIPGVILEVQKITDANTIEVVNHVKKILPDLRAIAGENYRIELVNDTSIFILKSLHEVEFDLVYGAILAVLIVFIFLRNFRATIVSALVLPSSILGTFALMSYADYTLDKMTLLGLALAIGILIDDAIVVIENIYKKLEHGMDRYTAALEGVKEIAFAVAAISAMLLAVFVPVAFMGGMVGKFFNSFALTVAFAIIISYIVAMTLIPSLSARVLNKGESRFYHATEPFFVAIDRGYVRLLGWALRHKALILIAVALLFVGSMKLASYIGKEFLPIEDNSEFQVALEAPAGVSLEEMIRQSTPIQQAINADKRVAYTTLTIGYDSKRDISKAIIFAKLIEKSKRNESQTQMIKEYRQKLAPISPRLKKVISLVPQVKGAGISADMQLVLKSDSIEKLSQAAAAIIAKMKEKPGIVDIDTDVDEGKPEARITLNRAVMERYGINAQEIATAISSAYSSDSAISQYDENGRQFDITLRLPDEARGDLEAIKRLQVRASNGQLISLEGVVNITAGTSPTTINHYDRERQVMVTANLQGVVLGDVVAMIEQSAKEILPQGVAYKFIGFAERMKETQANIKIAILAGVIIMYLILASLFESLLQPLIILVTLPLAIIGAFIALFITGKTLSLFTMIGIIMLMGMVGKNAVLLMDFANQYRQQGKSVDESLLLAGEKRLRPILMTTLAIIFGMLPVALALGEGSESKSPMATTIIGGLLSSMFLTLLVVPVLYRLLYPIDAWLRRWYEIIPQKENHS